MQVQRLPTGAYLRTINRMIEGEKPARSKAPTAKNSGAQQRMFLLCSINKGQAPQRLASCNSR